MTNLLAESVNAFDGSRQLWTLDRYLPPLLEASGMTIYISFVSFLLAMALGLLVALTRLYAPAPFRLLALIYVEFFRGIPVLLLIYFLYFGFADLLRLEALHAAILGFALNYAAYESEIYRAGISAVPAGQWEAAQSLGMSSVLAFRRIILPQAIRIILPPMTSDFIALFKDTSVVSVIAVVELTKQAQVLAKDSLKYTEIFLVTALLYLIMSVPLAFLSRYLEQRWGKGA